MLTQLFFILAVSLFDSLSTTQQIIIFVLMLTTVRPVRNSISYLAGLFAAYFACGLLGFFALDKLNEFASRFMVVPNGMPDSVYYRAEAFAGVIFLVWGVIYYLRKKDSVKPQVETMIIRKLKDMNIYMAFAIGVFISATSFPVSLPYIAALGKFALLKMSMPEVATCLLLYNIGYALPMIVIFAVYISMRGKETGTEEYLHEKARKLNLQLTSGMLVFMGLFSIADSSAFFILGHPLMKNKFF